MLARLYGEPGDGKSALQRIYATFAVDDVAYVDARGTAVKIARIEGRDLSGRQIPATWTGALQAFTAVDYERLAPPERTRLMSLGADLAEAVSVGSLEATGLSVQEAKPRDAFSLGIARLGLTGAGLLLEDISFAGVDGAKARLARLSLDGFSLGPTVAALRKLAALTTPPSDAELRLLTPALGTLALKDLSLDLPPEAKAPRDPAEKMLTDKALADRTAPAPTQVGLHVGLRDGSMNFAPPRDGVPTAGRLSLSGLTLPASAVAGVPGLGSLGLYGYSDLDLALVADTSWDEAARELKLGEVSVSGKDMGSLRIKGMIGGIGPEVFNPDVAVSSFAMLSATAKALDLTVENTGLFDRFIAAQSKVLSLKPEELKQEYVTASVFGVPAILGNSVGAKAIGAAMGQFVTKPGTPLGEPAAEERRRHRHAGIQRRPDPGRAVRSPRGERQGELRPRHRGRRAGLQDHAAWRAGAAAATQARARASVASSRTALGGPAGSVRARGISVQAITTCRHPCATSAAAAASSRGRACAPCPALTRRTARITAAWSAGTRQVKPWRPRCRG